MNCGGEGTLLIIKCYFRTTSSVEIKIKNFTRRNFFSFPRKFKKYSLQDIKKIGSENDENFFLR
jgi:hypothetical protein